MRSLIALLLLIAAPAAAQDKPPAFVERYYCTTAGPFFLRFTEDKAAGVFSVLANGRLGAVAGAMDGHAFSGEWMDTDRRGGMRLSFSEDWSSFETAYSVAPDHHNWLSGWTGYMPPAGDRPTFVIDGETFRCR